MAHQTNMLVIKKCRVKLQEVFHPYIQDILDAADAEDIIMHSDYNMFKDLRPTEQPRKLLDHLFDTGEEVCTRFFINVLIPYCIKNTALGTRIKREVTDVYEAMRVLTTDPKLAMSEATCPEGATEIAQQANPERTALNVSLTQLLDMNCEEDSRGVTSTPAQRSTVKRSTEEFYKSNRGSEDCVYSMMPRGPNRQRQALIINNMTFDETLSTREGSQEDVKMLVWLFKQLDYTPIVHKDQSPKQIENIVKEFATKEEHYHSDSAFVVIMSHGTIEGVCGKNVNYLLRVENVYTALNNENCVGLRNKPKIIIVQACRDRISRNSEAPQAEERVAVDSVTLDGRVPRESDMTCLYATLPTDPSYRDTIKGTFLIQTLVDVVKEYACSEHVQDLFTRVKQRCSEMNRSQMPVDERNSLRRKFYLFPGF